MAAIYIIKNKVNVKVYIGQTTSKIDTRFKKHLSQINCNNRCTALYNAILKHGKENFYIEEIVSGDYSVSELNILECFYISHYNSICPNGYNIQSGGSSFTMSESSSSAKSLALKGRKISWGEKISNGLTRRWQDEGYRNNMSASHTGKRGYKYKKHSKPLRLELDVDHINEMHTKGDSIYKIAKFYKVGFLTIKKRII